MQSSSRTDLSRIVAEFNAAIDRILAGTPNCPALMELSKNQKLKINFSTVAKEAGHSRTLIALQDCRLPDVRNRIIELMRDSSDAPYLAEIAKERCERKELEDLLENQMDEMHNCLIAQQRAERERELAINERDLARTQRDDWKARYSELLRETADEKIVPFQKK